ncbi:hypothetical protein D2E70_08450 [Mycobacteroides abscessus]|nr:hypothetical protein D2E70_08450 [Mycobacteroides abscessus]
MPVKHTLKRRLCVLGDQEASGSSLSTLPRLKEEMTCRASEHPIRHATCCLPPSTAHAPSASVMCLQPGV